MRESTSNYTFDGTKVSIPKGQKIWIPNYAIQRDPDIYPKPDVFDPERFNEKAVQSRHPMAYLSFGDGPRNCIGIIIKLFEIFFFFILFCKTIFSDNIFNFYIHF